MIDFPTSPATGSVVTAPNGRQWRWDGTAWVAVVGGVGGAQGRLAYAQVVADQALTGAAAPLTGLSVTINAVAGRVYRITAHVHLSSTVAGDVSQIYLFQDGSTQREAAPVSHSSAGVEYSAQVEAVVTAATSASATFAVWGHRMSGTGTVNVEAAAYAPAFILVEDITYEPGSAVGVGYDPRSPAGAIVNYIGTVAPSGWLAMIGQTVANGDTLYPTLWSVLPAGMKSGTSILMPDTRGRMAVGLNSADALFDAIGDIGGSKDAVVVSHTHTQAAHAHAPAGGGTFIARNGATYAFGSNMSSLVDAATTDSQTPVINSTGVAATNANLPPFITFLKIIRAY